MILLIKGFIIGLAKVVPGVSGSLVALNLGLYEKGIDSISNYFKDIKNNSIFLLKVGIGILIALIFGSKIISFLLNKNAFITMIVFIGLLLGSNISFFKKIKTKKEKIFILTTFIIMLLLFFIKTNIKYVYVDNFNNNIYVIILGFLDAATMIIPAISGTVIFILLGCYDFILYLFSNIFSNIKVFILFFIGLIMGIIVVTKIMSILLKNKRELIYSLINGFFLSSMMYLIIETIKLKYSIIDIIISIPMLILSYKIGSLNKE